MLRFIVNFNLYIFVVNPLDNLTNSFLGNWLSWELIPPWIVVGVSEKHLTISLSVYSYLYIALRADTPDYTGSVH